VCLWLLLDRPEYRRTRILGPAAAGVVLATTFTPQPVLWTGLTLAALVTVKLLMKRSARAV